MRYSFLFCALTLSLVSSPVTAKPLSKDKALTKSIRLALDKRNGVELATKLADAELGASWCDTVHSTELMADLAYLARRAKRPMTGLDCAHGVVKSLDVWRGNARAIMDKPDARYDEFVAQHEGVARHASAALYEASLMVGMLKSSQLLEIYEGSSQVGPLSIDGSTLAEAVSAGCTSSNDYLFATDSFANALFDVSVPFAVKSADGESASVSLLFSEAEHMEQVERFKLELSQAMLRRAFQSYPSERLAGILGRKKQPTTLGLRAEVVELGATSAALTSASRATCDGDAEVAIGSEVDRVECTHRLVLDVTRADKTQSRQFFGELDYVGGECGGYGSASELKLYGCESKAHKTFAVAASEGSYINGGACGPLQNSESREALVCEVHEGTQSCVELGDELVARRDEESGEFKVYVSAQLPKEVREVMKPLDGVSPKAAAAQVKEVKKKLEGLYQE